MRGRNMARRLAWSHHTLHTSLIHILAVKQAPFVPHPPVYSGPVSADQNPRVSRCPQQACVTGRPGLPSPQVSRAPGKTVSRPLHHRSPHRSPVGWNIAQSQQYHTMATSSYHTMAISSCLILALAASISCLPPPVPETTTPPAVTRTNGLINDVKEINLFLNIPAGCDSVYDGLIRQLEGCRSEKVVMLPKLPNNPNKYEVTYSQTPPTPLPPGLAKATATPG